MATIKKTLFVMCLFFSEKVSSSILELVNQADLNFALTHAPKDPKKNYVFSYDYSDPACLYPENIFPATATVVEVSLPIYSKENKAVTYKRVIEGPEKFLAFVARLEKLDATDTQKLFFITHDKIQRSKSK